MLLMSQPLSEQILISLTDLADLAVVLPLAITILFWLLAMRSPRAAVWWLIAVAICIGGTALLKIYFFSCPLVTELRSPSGHTSLGTLVYGTLILFTAGETEKWRRWAVIAIGALFILSIAVTRVLLHAHTMAEVVLGLFIGSVALIIFTQAYLRHRPVQRWFSPLFLVVAIIIFALHGHELRAEEFLHRISLYLGIATRFCG
jgi:membrane-associated phospholipid phosphatase